MRFLADALTRAMRAAVPITALALGGIAKINEILLLSMVLS